LILFSVMCYAVAGYNALAKAPLFPNDVYTILPVAAAIGVGCLIMLLESLLRLVFQRKAEALALAAVVFIAVIWLRPHQFVPQHLEYEVAAARTTDIKAKFPLQRWMVVAPVEQLPQTFGFGGFYDLAGFIEKYRRPGSDRDFDFLDAPEHLFVFVEKKPFQVFAREPASVAFSVLSDTTYRNYRSPAGRASLESSALQLCEDYRRNHTTAGVYFEDENLRIYHFLPTQQRARR
jgi:hypothetical protein